MKAMTVDNGYVGDLPANVEGKKEYFARDLFASPEGQTAAKIVDYETSKTAVNRPTTVGYIEFESILNATFADIRNGADPKTSLEQGVRLAGQGLGEVQEVERRERMSTIPKARTLRAAPATPRRRRRLGGRRQAFWATVFLAPALIAIGTPPARPDDLGRLSSLFQGFPGGIIERPSPASRTTSSCSPTRISSPRSGARSGST